jgi:hypothetical protein
MSNVNYLEQSITAVQSIDPDLLGTLAVGDELGNGTRYRAYSVGELGTARDLMHVGLKIPKRSTESIDIRVINDVTLGSLLIDRVPSLLPAIPRFVGALAVAGRGNVAVITEDVSLGGEHGVEYEVPVPDDVKQELFSAFGDLGSPEEVFDQTVLQRGTAFIVDGQLKFLDFLPSLFNTRFRRADINREAQYASDDRLDELIVTVAADSRLARSVVAMLR